MTNLNGRGLKVNSFFSFSASIINYLMPRSCIFSIINFIAIPCRKENSGSMFWFGKCLGVVSHEFDVQ